MFTGKAKEHMLSNNDALLKAESLEFPNLYQSINIKDNVLVFPIQMSQNDVEEVLISIASPPSSLELDGFA